MADPNLDFPARRFYDVRLEDRRTNFLESCFLCKKQLGKNGDIFMYRGYMPFCSEACREEMMEGDSALEKKKKKRSSSMKAAAATLRNNKDESPSKNQDFSLRPGTVAAS